MFFLNHHESIMNNLDKSEVYKILKETDEGCVRWAHGNGFEWLRDIFSPAIEFAQNTFVDEERLIANCFYVLGDIYDFNGAPLAAINAYAKAIHYDNQFAAAYREMAGMYQGMGDYEKALQFIEIAVTLNPEERNALSDRKFIIEDLAQRPEPLYKKSDVIWQCNELLADFSCQQALSGLSNSMDIDSCKARARCYGALADNPHYLKEWDKLSESGLEVEFEYSDWFYMPEQIFDTPEVWHILLSMYQRIKPNVFVSLDSLYESERYRNLERKEQYKLNIEFNIYRTEKNLDGLVSLLELYPNCLELKEVIDDLKSAK